MDLNNVLFHVLSVSAFREYLTSLWYTLRFDCGVIMPGADDIPTRIQDPFDYKSILSFFFPSDVVDILMPVFSEATNQGKLSMDAYSRLIEAMDHDDFHRPARLPERWAETLANRQKQLVKDKSLRQQISAEIAAEITSQQLANLQEQLKELEKLDREIEALEKPFVENSLAATKDPLTAQFLQDYGIRINEKDEIRMILALLWVWISALPHEQNAERSHQDFIHHLQLRIRALVPVNEFSRIAREAERSVAHIEKSPCHIFIDLVSKGLDQQLDYTDQSAFLFISNTNDLDNTPARRK